MTESMLIVFCILQVLPLFIDVWNRYDIFCKAAYAKLKPNNESDITPSQCDKFFYISFDFFMYTLMFCYWHGQKIYPGADAFEAAIGAVMLYGGAAAGYRTMLDALIPASTVLREVRNWQNVFLF